MWYHGIGAVKFAMPSLACCRVALNLRQVVGLSILFLLLLPLLDGGALGEELVPNSVVLPSVIPKRHGLPSRPTARYVRFKASVNLLLFV